MALQPQNSEGDFHQTDWRQPDVWGDEGNNYPSWSNGYLAYVIMQFPHANLPSRPPPMVMGASHLWFRESGHAKQTAEGLDKRLPEGVASLTPQFPMWMKALVLGSLCLLAFAVPIIVIAPFVERDLLVILATLMMSLASGSLWVVGRTGQRLLDEQA
jgi:hypothetical protein